MTKAVSKKQYSKYKGQWVFLSTNLQKVHAHDKSLKRLITKIQKTKEKGSIARVPLQGFDIYVG